MENEKGKVAGCHTVCGAGGVALLLSGMRGHAEHAEIQKWGCNLVAGLWITNAVVSLVTVRSRWSG